MTLYIDIETYSATSLDYGVYRYASDPSFDILMAAYSVDGGPIELAFTRDEVLAIPGLTDPAVLKIAHNAAFERICFSRYLGLPHGEYLPPEEWHDTMVVAAEHGRPQGLGMLAKALGAEQKDAAGTRLINLFCKPTRKGERPRSEDHPAEWLDFIFYCEQDVATLIDVHARLEGLGGWPTQTEQDVFHADQRINDRGIRIDSHMAREAVRVADLNEVEMKQRVRDITGGAVDNAGSVPQMLKWLKGEGLPASNVRAATLDSLLEGDLAPHQREVLELRQELALAASKKYGAALGAVMRDSRIRGSFRFFGAHTGRWSGRGTQLQNLPRAAMETEAHAEAAILDLKMGAQLSQLELKKLVRPMFTGPFTVVDYAAIEARVIAWLSSETWALDAFRDHRDIYVETAERMSTPGHQLTRFQGKVAVLALGYNGGVNSLRAMGADGNDEELQALVVQWRRANPRIVQLWSSLGDAFGEGGKAGPHLHVTHSTTGTRRNAHLHLPSGRAITYQAIKWEKYPGTDFKTGKTKMKEGWRYAMPSGGRMGTYGGRLAENATQAVARDLMAEALVRLERLGYPVVGHVHDEVIIDGEHDVEEIKKIMCELPAWASGLPVDGEGFTCARYRKG